MLNSLQKKRPLSLKETFLLQVSSETVPAAMSLGIVVNIFEFSN